MAYYLSEWAVRLWMLVHVPRRRSAAAARAWLLLIFLLPWPGMILYWLIGRPYLPRRRVELQARISQMIRQEQAERLRPGVAVAPDLPPQFAHVVQLAQNLGDFQILAGNAIELIDDYDAAIDRLVSDIDAAVHHVHLLYYIFADDRTGNRVADALIRAARERKISCRVLMDGRGSKRALRTLAPRLRAAGVEVVALLKSRLIRIRTARLDLRNHRKLAVIDGRIGYTGSQNIIDAGFKRPLVYEELVVRVVGPMAGQMQAVLLADRLVETGEEIRHPLLFPDVPPQGSAVAQLLPSGPGYPHENNQRFIVSLIHAATKRVVITSPYFVPDEPFVQAMTTAVLRGVEVHLVAPRQIDQYLVGLGQRSFYDELLDGGVRIHNYTKRFLHAKHVSIDDDVALIGSSNMDIRSFMLNAEVMLVVYDAGVVAELKRIQERYFADSIQITRQAWANRPAVVKVLQNTARLADSLL
ncbi:MAG TPA: cardiolipin synthase [Tepidisphaeraceae bacterium]